MAGSFMVFICTVFGIFSFVFAATSAVTFSAAAGIALDFWTAAGLIKLSHDSDWPVIVTAASLIMIRKLTGISLSFFRK
jgi:hypothetical protein